jgi:L-ascorbate metabolism protein UlaG (beta-lactamase superfamily)
MKNKTQIQFLAHASFQVITPENRVVLVDPWITNNHALPAGIGWPEQIDLILFTHGHEDHMDSKIVDIIRQKTPKVIANPMVRWYLIEQGVPAHIFEGMNIGGTLPIQDMRVTMTNAFHIAHITDSTGKVVFPHGTVGFVLQLSDGVSIYFAGDTGVFGDMQLIGKIYKPDIAVLPIGNRFTMGPIEAAYAIRLLKVKHVIPFHYGTMATLTGTPEMLRTLTTDLEDLHIHALKAGEVLDTAVIA